MVYYKLHFINEEPKRGQVTQSYSKEMAKLDFELGSDAKVQGPPTIPCCYLKEESFKKQTKD